MIGQPSLAAHMSKIALKTVLVDMAGQDILDFEAIYHFLE
jgi:hypothetical protein